MNQLSTAKRVQVVRCLLEGCSVSSASRLVGVRKQTILRLIRELGFACSVYHDQRFRNLQCRLVQADEIWSFIQCKEKQVTPAKKALGCGHNWLWIALCAESRLILSYLSGDRTEACAREFIADLASRLACRIQFTTDGLRHYFTAVEATFGEEGIDYSQLVKDFIAATAAQKTVFFGDPDPSHISTSYMERYNLTIRMTDRRFTRKTNGFSKLVENHFCSVALHTHYYNFGRVHMTLKTTPAIAYGMERRVWTVEDMVRLI